MREILRIQDRKKVDPATNVYRARGVIGTRGQATILLGEIHGGTNVVREPFTEPWWETELVR
jgi:hypothetical protein